jgi:hypothetical protein
MMKPAAVCKRRKEGAFIRTFAFERALWYRLHATF